MRPNLVTTGASRRADQLDRVVTAEEGRAAGRGRRPAQGGRARPHCACGSLARRRVGRRQTVPVAPGRDYLLTFFLRSQGFSRTGGYDGVNPQYALLWRDAGGKNIGEAGAGLPYAPRPSGCAGCGSCARRPTRRRSAWSCG